jgi:hypothetical protein
MVNFFDIDDQILKWPSYFCFATIYFYKITGLQKRKSKMYLWRNILCKTTNILHVRYNLFFQFNYPIMWGMIWLTLTVRKRTKEGQKKGRGTDACKLRFFNWHNYFTDKIFITWIFCMTPVLLDKNKSYNCQTGFHDKYYRINVRILFYTNSYIALLHRRMTFFAKQRLFTDVIVLIKLL